MKILKGVLTYTLILIGILAIAGILLFASMAFLNVSLFGYRITIDSSNSYYFDGETTKDGMATLNSSKGKIVDIVINSNNYAVIVSAQDWQDKDFANDNIRTIIRTTVADRAFGLVDNAKELKALNGETKVKSYLEVEYFTSGSGEDKYVSKVEINLHTPQGILNYRDSYIKVELPVANDKFAYNLTINSGKGDINIKPYSYDGTAKTEQLGKLNVNALNITTTSGGLSLYGLKEFTGEAIKSEYQVPSYDLADEEYYVPITNLNLKTEKGKFDFTQQNIIMVSLLGDGDGTAKIESNRGDFSFKQFWGGFTIKGENLVFNATEKINSSYLYSYIESDGEESVIHSEIIYRDFLYNCPNGTLNIKKLDVGSGLAQIVTEYAKVELGEVVGDLSIQATYGDTHINKAIANVISVETTHGNIIVDDVATKLYTKLVFEKDIEGTEDKEEKIYQNVEITNLEYSRLPEVLDTNWTLNVEKSTIYYYAGTVCATSKYGDINVKYSGKGWFINRSGKTNVEYVGTETNYETKIETVSGTVTAQGLKGQVNATATGSANMNLSFSKIPTIGTDTNSVITIGSGKLTINVPMVVSGTSAGFVINLTVNSGAEFNLYNASVKETTCSDNRTINAYQYGNYFNFNLTTNGGDIDFHIA